MDDLDDSFEAATNYVRLNARNIPKDSLLYFYARYKQATDGVCSGERPSGLFNFEAKSKYDAWKELNKMSEETAMTEYVNRLDYLYPEWRSQNNVKVGDMSDKSTFGIRLSTMTDTDTKLNDTDKTIFDWCKEGNFEHVKLLLKTNDINKKDESNMTLLMWACDRGNLNLVKYLIENNANVNEKDDDGQTCLHYAVSCEHLDIIKELCNNTNLNIESIDNDGLKAVDLTSNKEIIQILS